MPWLLCLLALASTARAETNTPAATNETNVSVANTRPPGGNGDQLYRVLFTQNDANGDGVLSEAKFLWTFNQRHIAKTNDTPAKWLQKS